MSQVDKIIYSFMGYCSVRYSTDGELALSDEDIKQAKNTATALSKYVDRKVVEGRISGKKEVIDIWIKNMKPLVDDMDKICVDNIAQCKQALTDGEDR